MATIVATEPRARRRPKIAPTPFEVALAAGAALMLTAMIAALLRGADGWGRIPPIVWFHLATIGTALLLTPAILLGKRGSPWHRRLGYVWAAALWTTALASVWIRESNPGHLSRIHLLSLFTLLYLPRVIWLARAHRVDAHRRGIQFTVAGALLIAGLFTLVPGRTLGTRLLG